VRNHIDSLNLFAIKDEKEVEEGGNLERILTIQPALKGEDPKREEIEVKTPSMQIYFR